MGPSSRQVPTAGEGPTSPVESGRRRVLKFGSVYVLANAAPRAIGFLLLPVYTRILSPADYGELSVALAVAAVAIAVFTLGLETALMREVFQLADDPATRMRLIMSSWTFLMIAPLGFAMLLSALAVPALGSSEILSAERFALSVIGAAVFVGATTVPLAVLRAEQRLRKYLAVNGIATILTAALVFVAVVVLDGGVTGWLVATLIGYVVTMVVSVLTFPYERPRPFDGDLVRTSLRLGLPVVPHLAAMLTLQLADRVLVAALISTAAAGVFSLASNMALPMMLGVLGFGQAFMPAYALAGKEGQRASLTETMVVQVTLVSLLCVACALLAPPAIHLVAGPEFQEAAGFVAWIVLGYGFWGFSQIPMNAITLTYGKTRGLFLVSGASAAANVGLILVFARSEGLEAVAIASAIGYAVLLVFVAAAARIKHATLNYPWRDFLCVVLVAVVGYGLAVATTGSESVVDAVVRIGWTAATAIGLGVLVLGRDGLAELPIGRLRSLRG